MNKDFSDTLRRAALEANHQQKIIIADVDQSAEWLASALRELNRLGWKIVGPEVTEEMIAAGWIDKEDVNPDEIFYAMREKAPTIDQLLSADSKENK